MTRHRNPLFSRRSHIGPESLCGDELHTLHLGVFADFVLAVLWCCLNNDVWSLRRPGEAEDAYLQRACLRLRAEIFAWYKAEKARTPETPLYELQDVDIGLIRDKKGKPRLDAKAAQTGTLLLFAVHATRAYLSTVPRGPALAAAGDCLVTYLRITRSRPLTLGPEDRQALVNAALGYLARRKAAGVPWKPKCRLLLHLVCDAGKFGNPGLTGTWQDESLNLQLAMVCKTAHAAVWSMRVLSEYNRSAGPAARVARAAAQAEKRRRRV